MSYWVGTPVATLERQSRGMVAWLQQECATPGELEPHDDEQLLLRYVRIHEGKLNEGWKRAVRAQLIFQKACASLEREFKDMRNIMSASSARLSHDNLEAFRMG
jgi:hypothetical protein